MTNLQIDPEVLKLGEEARETEQGPEDSKRLTTLVEEHNRLAALQADAKAMVKAFQDQMDGVKAKVFSRMAEAGLQNFTLEDGAMAYVQTKRAYGLVDPSYRQEALDWLFSIGAKYELNPTQSILSRICNEHEEAGEPIPTFIVKAETQFVVVRGGK